MTFSEYLMKKYDRYYITKTEAANETTLSTATIDRFRKSGDLKSKMIKGTIIISIEDLEVFMNTDIKNNHIGNTHLKDKQ